MRFSVIGYQGRHGVFDQYTCQVIYRGNLQECAAFLEGMTWAATELS